MIKEILLFVILFQSVNATETTQASPECKGTSSCTEFEKCSFEKGSQLMSNGKVCIPGGILKKKIQEPPFSMKKNNKIGVQMSNAQVIEIDGNTLTITASMDLSISWEDHRLQVITLSLIHI